MAHEAGCSVQTYFSVCSQKRETNEILAMAHTTYAVSSAFVGAGADVEGEKKTEGEIKELADTV